MSSIGILLTSRNNYKFMEKFWILNTLGKCDLHDYKILNIDEDSTEEEKKKGRELCDKHGISFIDREERGMHHNVDTAIRWFGEEVKHILWFQHDCWPLQKDFFYRFNKLVEEGKLDEFGTVGFNAIAQNMFKRDDLHNEMMKRYYDGEKPLGVLARSSLESVNKRNVYYCGVKSRNKISVPVPNNLFRKPFACAVPIWYAISVNVEYFKKNIDLDRVFHFITSWDDIAFQFLNKNIYNLVLPDFYIEHRPDLKPQVGLPKMCMRLLNKGDGTYHSLSGISPKAWINQWGWDISKPYTFEKVKKRYRGTLLRKFYKFDYTKGPLKVFEL